MPMVAQIVEDEGMTMAVFVTIHWFFVSMVLMLSFVFMHLAYYIVSSYIQLIALDLKQPLRRNPVVTTMFRKIPYENRYYIFLLYWPSKLTYF